MRPTLCPDGTYFPYQDLVVGARGLVKVLTV